MSEHIYALRAVARDANGVPRASDMELKAAKEAGLIKFSAWPSGNWSLTPKGRAALYAPEGGIEQ